MVDELHVDYLTLSTAAEGWRVESARVTTAQTRLADAPVSGFGTGVRGDVAAFLGEWSGTVGTSAAAARAISENLDDAHAAYLGVDVVAQDAFRRWLEQAP